VPARTARLAGCSIDRISTATMSAEGTPVKKKGPEIDVLRCLDPACRGMLAYEVTAQNILNPDLYWMARQDGSTRYFPCPKCGGRNVVEEVRDAKGALRHAVTRFEPAGENRSAATSDDDLTLIPRSVRDKLDRVGIKLHLEQWALLTVAERRDLVDAACELPADVDRYRTQLSTLIRQRTGRDPDVLVR